MIPPDFFNNNYLFAEKARLFANLIQRHKTLYAILSCAPCNPVFFFIVTFYTCIF